jgi:hypothetical protein
MKTEIEIINMEGGLITRAEIDGTIYTLKPYTTKPPIVSEPAPPSVSPPVNNSKKRRRRKPKGAAGYDKTYGVYIRKKDVNSILQQLREYPEGLSTSSLIRELGISQFWANATIHFLKEKRQIHTKLAGRGKPLYCLTV